MSGDKFVDYEMIRKSLERGDNPSLPLMTAVQHLAYVKGYILACEDILKDYAELDPDSPAESLVDVLAQKVQESLDSARRTLEKLS